MIVSSIFIDTRASPLPKTNILSAASCAWLELHSEIFTIVSGIPPNSSLIKSAIVLGMSKNKIPETRASQYLTMRPPSRTERPEKNIIAKVHNETATVRVFTGIPAAAPANASIPGTERAPGISYAAITIPNIAPINAPTLLPLRLAIISTAKQAKTELISQSHIIMFSILIITVPNSIVLENSVLPSMMSLRLSLSFSVPGAIINEKRKTRTALNNDTTRS